MNTDLTLGAGFAWFRAQCINPTWVILVSGHGAFRFVGTELEAEEVRVHKARWEAAIARKRPLSWTDITEPSLCWNHPGFVNRYRYACDCAECS